MFTIIESPYAGDVTQNLRYVRACMRDCFERGEVPFASHALYTQPGVLDDNVSEERTQGIDAGFAVADALLRAPRVLDAPLPQVAVYTDLGLSRGMAAAVQRWKEKRVYVIYRQLKHWEG
jgi:hypothetical protein